MAKLIAEANRLIYTSVEPLPPQPKDKGPQLFDNTGGEFISHLLTVTVPQRTSLRLCTR